jgi:hypothetical protein
LFVTNPVIHGLEFSLHPVGSSAGLPFALSKSESPEVRGSGFDFHSGDISGVDSYSGAENWKGLLLVVVFWFWCWVDC